MTASNYSRSLAKVLKYEGGYSNDAGDPGGATMWGITHIDYDAYRKANGLRTQDVRKMTIAERDSIYKNKYWTKSHCDELPSGVDFVVFDGSVNSGIGQSIKWMQRAVGVTTDGKIGPTTIAAVDAADDGAELVNDICDQRLRFLKGLKHWSIFGKGWSARVKDVRATGLAWIEPDEMPVVGGGSGKAITDNVVDDDETEAVGRGVGIAEIAEGVGSVAGTVGTVTTQVKPLFKSHISTGAMAMGAGNVAVAATLAPPSLWDQFIDIWKSPIWWMVMINIGLTVYIIWHYYKDHGRGALKDHQ